VEIGNPSALYLLVLVVAILVIAARSQRSLTRSRQLAALGLRLLVLLSLVGALADLRVTRNVDRVAVAYLLDHSASIPAAERERAAEWVRSAIEAKSPDDRAAIVVFGGDSLVERSPSASRDLLEIVGRPSEGETDIASAIRLAVGLLPGDAGRRIVILSDGRETTGSARQAAAAAEAAGVQVMTVPLEATLGDEVFVSAVDTPGLVREGEKFQTRVTVEATREGTVTLHLLVDGRVASTQQVRLSKGTNTLVIPHVPLPPGFHSIRVQLDTAGASGDSRPENNEGAGYVVVGGQARTLLAEATPGEGDFLARLLRAGGVDVETKPAASLPSDLTSYQGYESVILANVPAKALSDLQWSALRDAVGKLGVGLVVVGGDQSYGAGGYGKAQLADALPVKMERRGLNAESGAGVILVIDTSGSMGSAVGGTTKMTLAREAATQALKNLNESDVVGILAFEDRPRWVLEPEKLGDGRAMKAAVSQLQPGGGTEIYSALLEAEQKMMGVSARVRHVVLLTDGISPPGEYDALTARLRQNSITLSTIGIGLDADQGLLKQLADTGGGRFYDGSDPFDVPQLLVKETQEIARAAIVEETFRPAVTGQSPILEGLAPASLPPLRGYVATTAKPTSQTLLSSQQGDPILVEWQYGLGRVVAWTSDAKNRWAASWLDWPEAVGFWSRMVKRVFPNPQEESLQTRVVVQEGIANVTVDSSSAVGGQGNFLSLQVETIRPDGSTTTTPMRQVAPGRYAMQMPADQLGAYMLRVTQPPRDAAPPRTQAVGFTVDGSAEFRHIGRDDAFLAELARAGGGRVLQSPAESVRHDLSARGGEPAWGALTVLAAALFLGDVAARRVRVSLTTARKVLARTSVLRRRFRGAALPIALGSRLLDAKRRAPAPSPRLVSALSRRRRDSQGAAGGITHRPGAESTALTAIRPQMRPIARRQVQPQRRAAAAPSRGELGARLLAAKQRAKG